MANRVLQVPKQALQSAGISQDNIIFGMVLLAFVIFITIKGELSQYMAFFTPGANLGPAAVPVSTTAQTSATTPIATGLTGAINSAINSTGLGGLITGLTGTQPLTLGTTGGGILGAIGNFFGGQGISGNATPVTTPLPSTNPPSGGIGSA
jgi:hypothetical protein